MTLRPISARWFELITVHQDLARTMESLSRTGAVELEATSAMAERVLLPGIDEPLKAYRELAKRYRTYWPVPGSTGKRRPERLLETLTAAGKTLGCWQEAADPIIAAIEQVSSEHEDLTRLRAAFKHAGAEFPDLRLLAGAGPWLRARLLLLPTDSKLREVPALALCKTWEADRSSYALVVGRRADILQLEAQLLTLKGRVVPLPAWLPSSITAAVSAIDDRLACLAAEKARLSDEIVGLNERLGLAGALSNIALTEWLSHHASELRGSGRLAWITGWTSDIEGHALRRALDAEAIRYVLRVSSAPRNTIAPSVLANPRWVRAFEVFPRMLGTPASDESDPSIVLAVVAPLIFGMMFGDVGQGLVIFIVGLVLGPRVPLLQMLVPGGLAAAVFGLAFGSVFCREDLIPALWIRPLADPIVILIASIALGVVVLSIGLALDALQAHWRGQARRWWGHRAGLLVVYLGMLAVPVRIEGLLIAALGAAWYLAGAVAAAATRRLRVLGRAGAELVEEGLRLLVNTVSFARVGAFALAHAGLSAAIVELASASGRIGYWLVLFAGNVLVIGLEGTVVSIQTTRLMLFEFFIRFLAAGGRAFKPLPPPDLTEIGYAEPKPGGYP
jgi:V/A-type H+-transporting ATPase subunit I